MKNLHHRPTKSKTTEETYNNNIIIFSAAQNQHLASLNPHKIVESKTNFLLLEIIPMSST